MLTSCHTARIAYDERPENKQPVLERPAWPNYNLHNDRSFAAFSHIQTAQKGEGIYVQNEDGSMTGLPNTIYRCKDATYLCLDYIVPEKQELWFRRFTTGSALIDADTGDRYLLQRVEHFPIDQCFLTYGQKNETIRFVLVYPPLPPSVKCIQVYEASAESSQWMNGTGSITKPISIEDLRPHAKINQSSKKQERIIR